MPRLIAICAIICAIPLATAATTVEQWALEGPPDSRHEGSNVAKLRASAVLVAPAEPVIVAVIDSGFELEHEDLAGLWLRNEAEANGAEGVDDDNNGFVDDVLGWNFIGNADGTQLIHGRMELTRVLAALDAQAAAGTLDATGQARRTQLQQRFAQERMRQSSRFFQHYGILSMHDSLRRLAAAKGVDPDDKDAVIRMPVDNAQEWLARDMLLATGGRIDVDRLRRMIDSQLEAAMVQYDLGYSESAVIGDDPATLDERGYGNPVVEATRDHGTAVVSVIAAHDDNEVGIAGHCPSAYVRLLPIRAVPDGDERDKDVANALRYAVDRGARIVNMSFGKGFSPDKAYVDEAMAYARDHGVLVVIGAGNDGRDLDRETSYPNDRPLDPERHGERFENVILVGANGAARSRALAAPWSNYGKESVHLFAPGESVQTATLHNSYGASDGTSLSAPVVTGVLALLWSQFPDRDWQEIRTALLEGVRTPDVTVMKPGGGTCPFAELSRTGGIIDAWRSYQLLKTGSLPETGTGED